MKKIRDNSWESFAIIVLKKKNKPMRLNELTEEILKIKKIHNSRTPNKTLYSTLRKSKEFTKSTSKLYGLREWIKP